MMFYTGDVSGIVAFSDLFDSLLTDNGWLIHRSGGNGERHYTSPVVGSRPSYYFGRVFSNDPSSGRYNWVMRGFQYPDPDKPLNSQPKVTPRIQYFQLCSPDISIRYWLSVTADRVTGWVRIGQQYLFIYQGFYISYQTPDECPFHVASMGSSAVDHTYTSLDRYASQYPSPYIHSVSPIPAQNQVSTMCYYSDEWMPVWSERYTTDPNVDTMAGSVITLGFFQDGVFSSFQTCQADSGEHVIQPSVLMTRENVCVVGELDGVGRISGFNITPETELMVGPRKYIAFPNHTRADDNNFCVLEVK